MKRSRTDGIIVHRAEVVSGRDYHFLIERSGFVRHMVPVEDAGEHSCRYNKTTLAIAIFGDFASAEKGRHFHPTTPQIESCLGLIKHLQSVYGTKMWIAGHSELGLDGTRFLSKLKPGHTCPGENFPLDYIIEKSLAPSFPFPRKSVNIS